MSMSRNKRTGDKNQCNETDKNSGYFKCPATKLFLIMQNYVFCNITLIYEKSIKFTLLQRCSNV